MAIKPKQYYTVGTVPNSNRKIREKAKLTYLAHKYMTVYLHGLVQAFQNKRARVKLVL